MPNFDISIVSGVVPTRWADERAPHRSNVTHIYRRIVRPTGGLATVVFHALVSGVLVADAGLMGNLFTVSRVAWSGSFPFAIVQTPGTSAEVTLSFSPLMPGHQELCVRRPGGGAILLSFEVE